MKTIQILKRARKLLQKGWCQRDPVKYDERGRPVAYCILGALSFASQARWPTEQFAAKKRIQEVLGPKMTILRFNDEAGRTQDDVLSLLEVAIKHEAATLPWWQRVLW